jgi:hypothetical protein
VAAQVSAGAQGGLDFVPSAQLEEVATAAGLDSDTTAALVEDYEAAQLRALKVGLLASALLVLLSLPFTRNLPSGKQPEDTDTTEPVATNDKP